MTTRGEIIARLRYEFDKSMAAGPVALIGWLALISFVLILLAALVIALFGIGPEGGQGLGFFEAFWASLMRTLDPGTMGADSGWGLRFVMLFVTLGGIFVVSALIGVLSTGIEERLIELRKGRSKVLETDHTIILNWSPSIFDVIAQLCIANQHRRNPRIVILADRDKVAMEDEIAARITDRGRTRIICRSGDPSDLYDLSLVSPQTSRAIIVLSPEGDDPDSRVIKTILALCHDPARRPERYRIVAEIREQRNVELAEVVGGHEVQLVLGDDVISRIVVHSSRQAGLSAVYSELLDFSGSEIYTLDQPALSGNTFGDSLMAYNSAALIGVRDITGRVFLNPPMDTIMQQGLQAIVIAPNASAVHIAADSIEVDIPAIADGERPRRRAERTLLLGWNRRAPIIARELSRYVERGSVLTIAADIPDLDKAVARLELGSANLAIEYGMIDTGRRAALETLNIPSYDNVLVLGYSDHLAPQPTDTRTLVTLLHLRAIAEAAGGRINVVSEMIDLRNRELAEVTRADDFVVSNRLVSLMLAQASENESFSAIFDDLLDVEGSEIYMRPASGYVALGRPVNFYTIVEAARRRDEIAIGYARRREDAAPPGLRSGVVVNPTKTEAVTYQPGDRIIVLARD